MDPARLTALSAALSDDFDTRMNHQEQIAVCGAVLCVALLALPAADRRLHLAAHLGVLTALLKSPEFAA